MITIIVLLILAGVTVATLTGDNGLLTKTGAGGILGGHGNAQTWSTVEIYNCYNADRKQDPDAFRLLFPKSCSYEQGSCNGSKYRQSNASKPILYISPKILESAQ